MTGKYRAGRTNGHAQESITLAVNVVPGANGVHGATNRHVQESITLPANAAHGTNGVHGTNGAASGRATSADHRLFATIPALLFTSRPDGTWDDVSLPFCAYTGRPADALLGLNWVGVLHADDQAASLACWQAATIRGIAWQIEHRVCGADGVYRWFRTACAPQHDAVGVLRGWAGIAVSVESEHQLADERALRQGAEQARDDRDSMLAIIAHELRAPLTVLLGQASLLQRRMDTREGADPRDRRAATTLVAQSIRLNKLLSALLDVTQLDYGQLRICAITLDMGALVGRVVDSLAPTLPSHRLQLHADPAPLWVEGDALRLEQVLQNLLQNAVKYSPEGGEIMIRTAPQGEQVQIEVCDQGIGIPAEVQPYLFQRHFRARAEDRRQVGGLGLGLYLCKAIMDLHGGSIAVQSVEGEGCTVTLRFQRVQLQACSVGSASG